MAIVKLNGNTSIVPALLPPTSAEKKKMTLSAISNDEDKGPRKTIIYGPRGIGKTTFAAKFPKSVFFSTEGGLKGIKPAPLHFPEATEWGDIFDAIESLRTDDHDYQYFNIDSLDWLEAFAQKKITEVDGVSSIEKVGGGWQKGLVAASEEFRRLIHVIEKLRKERNIAINFIAHSKIKAFTNPLGDNFDKYQMKLDERVNAIFQEWADEILFVNYEIFVEKDNKKATKGKAHGGEKFIYAVSTPAWDAKNRLGITEPIGPNADGHLNFEAYWNIVKGESK